MADTEKKVGSLKSKSSAEQKLKARAVSRGISFGKIVPLYGRKRQFYRISLQENQISKELRRFRAALRLAQRQVKKLSQHQPKSVSETQANIFDAHLMLLEDAGLSLKIETVIQEQKVNAEWAVKIVTDRYLAIYNDIQDEHLRERRIDFQDVTERVLSALGGREKTPLSLEKDSIIVANEVNPSTLVELSESNLKAIVTETGGWTSHTFILARELGIPAVTGLKGVLRRVRAGNPAIVDGYHGQFIINPQQKTIAQHQRQARKFQNTTDFAINQPKDILKTLDGKTIIIRANLDIAQGYAKAKRYGAQESVFSLRIFV